MVVTPSELEKKVRVNDALAIGRAETQIDAALEQEFNGAEAYIMVPDCDQRVLQAVMQRYRAVGWTVKYESDQRDGDALRFTKPAGRSRGRAKY